MPKIPIGNFGNVIAQPAPHVQVPSAANNAGAMIAQAADNAMRTMGGLIDEEQRKQEEIDRSRAMVAISNHQSAVQDELDGMKEKLATGDISRGEAPKVFSEAIAKIKEQNVALVPEWLSAQAGTRIQSVEQRAMHGLNQLMEGQRRQELAGNLETIRDMMAKDAGRPGADIDKLNAEFEIAAKHLGPQAGIGSDKVGKLVQDFKDRNWFNQAQGRATDSQDSLDKLRALENDLKDGDGFYFGKLDTEKRNALRRTVVADRTRLENRLQSEEDRRLADADKAIREYREQITTTTKARPDDYLNWLARVRGTPHEAQFVEMQAIEREVQKVVALPPEQQDKFLSDARAAQRIHGAGEKQIKMLNALEEAVGKNRKLMDEQPLRYLTERTGQAFQPLTPAMLQQGGDAIAQEVRTRLSALSGLRKTTGGRTDLKLFSKDEADQIGKVLADAPAGAQGVMLGLLRNAINDPRAYADTVRQVSKDDPVLAYAGVAQGRSLATTNGRALSDLLLEGRAIIRDGSFKMPAEKAGGTSMQQTFSEYVGNAIEPGASSAREDTFKAASAVYAKLAKDAGKTDGSLDTGLYEQAVRLVTGGVLDHAGYKTIPPYGMSDDVFNDRARSAKFAAEKANDAPAGSFTAMQMRAIGPNRYELLNGQRRQIGKDGAPIILTIE